MSAEKINVGFVFTNNQGSKAVVVDYINSNKVLIEFDDEFKYRVHVRASQIRSRCPKNPYHPTYYDVGYIGVGEHKYLSGAKHSRSMIAWRNMLKRCYGENSREESQTYADCTVHPDWHNYQVFSDWFHAQKKEDGWALDKDLMIIGNRVYSAETCSMVPPQINTLLNDSAAARGLYPVGVNKIDGRYAARVQHGQYRKYLGVFSTQEEAFHVYKKAKERRVKEMANIYKEVLHPQIYENLISYSVEITD